MGALIVMNNSQRWFLVASLILLATVSALYCLDYRVVDGDSPEGQLAIIFSKVREPFRESVKSVAESNPDTSTEVPLIDFGEKDELVATWHAPRDASGLPTTDDLWKEANSFRPMPTFSGIYARPGLSRSEAIVGGFVTPALLAIFACFLALGSPIWRELLKKLGSGADPDVHEIY